MFLLFLRLLKNHMLRGDKVSALVRVWVAAGWLLLASRGVVRACFINGYESGVCEDPGEYSSDLWFCGEKGNVPRVYA